MKRHVVVAGTLAAVLSGFVAIGSWGQGPLGEELTAARPVNVLPYEITTDGGGSCVYPVRVSPGDLIDALITVDYEIAPHRINEGYPPEVTILVAESLGSGLQENPVDWESYSAELDDQRRVRLQLEMPPGGDIVLKMRVTHERTWVSCTPDNLSTRTGSDRETTIQLTVRGTEYDVE